MVEVQSGGNYFKMQDGQSAELIFDLDNVQTGRKSRIIQTKEGEKKIERFCFLVWNPQLQWKQLLELADKWVKRALHTMKEFNTTTLTVRRSGNSMANTDYSFLPVGLKLPSSSSPPSDEQ